MSDPRFSDWLDNHGLKTGYWFSPDKRAAMEVGWNAAMAAAPRQASPSETGWLVEDEFGRLCIGLECGNKLSWVTFTNENAIRFARKRDAENAITLFKLNGQAREHSWG